MTKITVVTRSFQASAGIVRDFDEAVFAQARSSISVMLNNPLVRKLVVITNGDQDSPFCEAVTNDRTATGAALHRHFADQMRSGRLLELVCRDWGENPGSASALSFGIEQTISASDSWVMVWSPEIQITQKDIQRALEVANHQDVQAIGFLREHWWERVQWNVIQNTAALWKTEPLLELGIFDSRCDRGEPKLFLPDFGEVSVGGMEDFHYMLRLLHSNSLTNWSMCGIHNPLVWDVDFEKGSRRLKEHEIKVARQEAVMRIYSSEIFPNQDYVETMGALFRKYSCY